jgi:uncharacterized protein (TIGR02453 family)
MPAAHFTKDTFDFLRELKDNNRRDWFEANKARYREHVLEPAVRFVSDFEAPLAKISASHRADPRSNGGSIFRIHRDTRFSKDKSPYKTHLAMQFRHFQAKDVHTPGFYVHLEPGGVFVGIGIWHPDGSSLGRIRAYIIEKPARWKRVIGGAKFTEHFHLEGESLKRAPAGIDPGHPLIEDLKRKDFVAVANLGEKDATRAGFLNEIATVCRAGSPFVRYLCDALDLAF